MIRTSHNRASIVAAAITASLLVLASGLTHRIVVACLVTPMSTTPIDPDVLRRFPMQIGDWVGEDVPLDKAIPRRINAEACINRRYSRRLGSASILLFMAASGITTGSMVGHAPEICNVRSGSTLVDQHSMRLPIENEGELPCMVLEFSRGGSFGSQKKTVLCYYVADGEFYDNRSVLRSRVLYGSSMIHCVGQVQIVASDESLSIDSGRGVVSDFAIDSASVICGLFKHIADDLSL